MIGGLMKTSSRFAIIAAAGILAGGLMTPAQAGGLGGDCCADLEERVAELEATTVRKGNRKVSVKIYGFVTRALLIWEDDNGAGNSRSDVYGVDIAMSGISRWGIKGGAKITPDISVGYRYEWGIGDTLIHQTTTGNLPGNGDDGVEAEGLVLRHSVLHLTSKQFGTVSWGHSHTASDGISQIDLSGTRFHARSNVNASIMGGSFVPRGLFNNLDGGGRGDRVRYDSPKIAGFVMSASWGESDYWDAALRYAGQFGDFKVAGGVAYIQTEDEQIFGGRDSGGCGNVSGGFSPFGQQCFMGSGGVLHKPTGFNFNVAAGQSDLQTGGGTNTDYQFYYLKAGVLKNWFGYGKTGAYAEYWHSELDPFGAANDSEGTMWGLGVVQNFDSAVFQMFIGYRHFEEDADGDATDDEYDATVIGGTIKF